ncbi:TetR/AcrR family transcriptional regulator [Roseivivax sp. CAU 1753]
MRQASAARVLWSWCVMSSSIGVIACTVAIIRNDRYGFCQSAIQEDLMRDEGKALRQEQIEKAAYAVLEEKGYAGASMLAIARKARASNETLYNWYGDKTGLFRALVGRNAAEVKALLAEQIADRNDATETLRRIGPVLLALVTSDRAVALNRAAAADPTGDLGRTIAEEGRSTVLPLIAAILEQGRAAGQFAFEDTFATCETYIGLLIGDLQIRRVVGRMPQPDEATLAARSKVALGHFETLFAPGSRA